MIKTDSSYINSELNELSPIFIIILPLKPILYRFPGVLTGKSLRKARAFNITSKTMYQMF